ncbi:MAG: hypothetical protein JNM66_04690 [Bryobacterales bacterium]|nr:hypothetical protein [Bryobacterales bacterium]
MVNSGNPRIRSLATVSKSRRIPLITWTDEATIELHKALAATGRAFLLGEVAETDGETSLRIGKSLPFPANLRPDQLMSVRDWQTLNEEIRRLAGKGLVGVSRLPDPDTERGAAADRKILEKYNTFGIRYVAEVDLRDVVQALGEIATRPAAAAVELAPVPVEEEAPAPASAAIETPVESVAEPEAEPRVAFALMPVSREGSALSGNRPEVDTTPGPPIAEVPEAPVLAVAPVADRRDAKKSPVIAVAAGLAAVLVCGVGIWAVGRKPAAPPPAPVAAVPVAVPVKHEPAPKALPPPTVKAVVRPVIAAKPVVAMTQKAKAAATVQSDAIDAQKAKREAALRALEQQ